MDYLINTRTPWEEPHRARHQLAYAIAKKSRVFFVAANKKGLPKLEIFEACRNLFVLQPYFIMDHKIRFRFPLMNELFQLWLCNKLKIFIHKKMYLINFDHSNSFIMRFFRNSCYFCNDNFIRQQTGKLRIISLYHSFFCEALVAKNAMFCVSVSNFLRKKLAKYNSNSFLLLLGSPMVRREFIRDDFEKVISGKVEIVYVGWLSKLNAEWVKKLSKTGKYHIKLIGPFRQKDVEIYAPFKNIQVMGPLTDDSLCLQIGKAHLTIAPYKMSKDVSEVYSMPNKFWLYLAHGKPVITCNIDNLITLPQHFIYRSSDYDDFEHNIEIALKNNCGSLSRDRRSFALKNSWDTRAQELEDMFVRHLGKSS